MTNVLSIQPILPGPSSCPGPSSRDQCVNTASVLWVAIFMLIGHYTYTDTTRNSELSKQINIADATLLSCCRSH